MDFSTVSAAVSQAPGTGDLPAGILAEGFFV
jgi:hypothetical protein